MFGNEALKFYIPSIQIFQFEFQKVPYNFLDVLILRSFSDIHKLNVFSSRIGLKIQAFLLDLLNC